VSNRLQEQMEAVKQLPFDEIAMTGLPPDAADHNNPNWRVNGTNYAVERNGTGLSAMAYNGGSLYPSGTLSGGAVPPTNPEAPTTSGPFPTRFTSGDVVGTVYRYVVWRNDPNCSDALCPGTQDLKRIIVGVTLDDTASGGARTYQELQADVVDPEVTPVDNAAPPGGGGSKFWNFWLTDTPCNYNTRQLLTGHHDTHNTLGACGAGVTTGPAAGAPDLMFTEPPEIDDAFEDDEQPDYDYSTDVEPSSNPDQDSGVQVLKPSQNGCTLSNSVGGVPGVLQPPSTETSPRWKVHKWVSPAIPSGYDILLNGTGTLTLWSQTVNGAVHPGKICVYLFTRENDPDPVDTPAVNQAPSELNQPYFTATKSAWPAGTWDEVKVPLSFTALNISPGERLGVAIAVERQNTTGDGLQFMYDHPSFDSYLQVQTDSLLPLFNEG
jgi:hypothetical protein